MIRAGKLRHRVTIQQKSVTRNTFGEEVVTWQDVATVWAAIEPLRGREFFESQQINAEVTTQITIRYRDGIAPEMRIIYNSKIYDIQAAINTEERDKELILLCKEVI